MVSEIDDVDRKILCLLSGDPQVSQAEISDRLKISQPAVSARIRKLEEKGVLSRLIGTDVKKAQLFLAKVDITTNQVEQFLKSVEDCPLYLNCFLTSGTHNMTCLLMGEDMRSVMSCVDSRFRQNESIKNMECDLVMTPTKPYVVPVKPHMEKKKINPCGKDCSACAFYTSDRCLGCPSSIYYKGHIL
ncbi:MAG TPA: winged helix-turn-helix transcriptional regulator [Candidatus Acidoferrum sp.]|nr:winged helix-turn-helix transcriptional regulator [Candidatus Acidoferrum sp.]